MQAGRLLVWNGNRGGVELILDASGAPLRRRIGFLTVWEREREVQAVELVSAVAFSAVETESEAEGTDEQNER